MIKLGIGNRYGEVIAEERDGKFYLSLSDYVGLDILEISEELYRAIEKEFSK